MASTLNLKNTALIFSAGVTLLLSTVVSPAAVIMDQLNLSMDAHQVSGTVTVVDLSTLRIENFTYDGGGLDVYFYLGTQESKIAFTNGLEIGPQLLGTIYDGSQPALIINLPMGESMTDYNAISVWCVDVSASFGSGTFDSVPEPSTSLVLLLSFLPALLYRRR